MPVEIRTKAAPPQSFINRLLDNRHTASPEQAKVTTHPLRTVTRVMNAGTQSKYEPTAGPPILSARRYWGKGSEQA
jgi:hypothetical protein